MEHLFSKEAIITQRTYIIDADIVKAITLYDFTENIGQLASEIKFCVHVPSWKVKRRNLVKLRYPMCSFRTTYGRPIKIQKNRLYLYG